MPGLPIEYIAVSIQVFTFVQDICPAEAFKSTHTAPDCLLVSFGGHRKDTIGKVWEP